MVSDNAISLRSSGKPISSEVVEPVRRESRGEGCAGDRLMAKHPLDRPVVTAPLKEGQVPEAVNEAVGVARPA